jgi:hypothetical protein
MDTTGVPALAAFFAAQRFFRASTIFFGRLH